VAFAPPLALKVVAGLAVAFAVAHADRGHPIHGRTAITVSRAEGNRWIVTRTSTLTALGAGVERKCSRGYSFRLRHWQDLGCRFNTPSGRVGASRRRASFLR
jgi:hypothetical protein